MAERLSATGRSWLDPAPVKYPYPWSKLSLPWIPTEEEALKTAEEMKKRGNQSFKDGDYYDSLWKYEHANTLLDSFECLKVNEEVAVLHSNISASCMKLGDEGRLELLHSVEGFPIHQIMWYGFSHQHAQSAIVLQPKPKIACKAFRRRGESFKKMLAYPGMEDAITLFMPEEQNPYSTIIMDYITSCELQESPDAKVYYEAIVMAVNEDQTAILPPLTDDHIKCGLSSKILKEAFIDPESNSEHLEFLLFDMEIASFVRPYYDASSLSPSTLLRKNIYIFRLYEKLVEYGMHISSEDVNLAVNVLPANKLKLLKLLVSKCLSDSVAEQDMLEKACESASRLNKRAFLDALKDFSKSSFSKLKDEGNTLFVQGDYEQALGKYFQALKYCREHKMKKEQSLIRANCAQACLKLELFSDAFTHCCECVKLDKTNHKGYYRRAEARKALIRTSMDYGDCTDVVKDYLKCHEILQPCMEAFCQAVILAVKYACTQLIPKFRISDVRSGFTNEFMKHLYDRNYMTERLFLFVILKLPDNQLRVPTYNARYLDLKFVLSKTTDSQVVKRLLDWGIYVGESDLLAATRTLRDTQIDVYEQILARGSHHIGAYHSCINEACNEAIQIRKGNFVVALIKQGSTPPPDLLLSIEGLLDHPDVQDYLDGVRSAIMRRQYRNSGLLSDYDELAHQKDHISDLSYQAKQAFRSGDLKAAARQYQSALQICTEFRLTEEAATIHNNMAHLYLRDRRYDLACKHSTESIRLSGNHKAYFRRAEAYKHLTGSTYAEKAIKDYKKSFELKADLKTLLEAILLANDTGKLSLLLIECKTLPEKLCLELLKMLLPRLNCKASLLSFLMLQAWDSKRLDCSSIHLKQVLAEKKVTSPSILKKFLECGAVVQKSDISFVINSFPADDISIFRLVVSNCESFDKNEVCREAANANKIVFALHMVELGAVFPQEGTKLFREALKVKEFGGAKVLLDSFSKELVESMDLAVLLETTSLVYNSELVEKLIAAGISVAGKTSPITVIMGSAAGLSQKIDMLCSLIERGVDCKQLCSHSHKTTSPLHVATEMALSDEGNVKLIKAVVASESFDKAGKLVNDRGETPLHLACKPHVKKCISCVVLESLLDTGLIDPTAKDKANKRPRDHIPTKDAEDPRIKLLDSAASKMNPEKRKGKKKKKKKGDGDKKKDPPTASKESKANEPTEPKPDPPKIKVPVKKEVRYEELTSVERITYHFNRIRKEDDAYFRIDVLDSSLQESIAASTSSLHLKRLTPTLLSPTRHPALSPDRASVVSDRSYSSPARSSDITVISDGVSELELEGLNFDSLPWEVEVTRNVVKFFRNTKKYSPTDRVSAARVIYSIAEGRRNRHLSKQVGSNQNVNLYEARITSSGRILWDKAINFSAKLTGDASIPMYTEVIRVWEVILDHDDLDHKIEYCSEQIVQSYERGYLSAVRYPLRPMLPPGSEQAGEATVRGKEMLDMPCVFTTQTLPKAERHFVPAASTNESEYNVTTFYSFDTVTVKSMIAGGNDKRDYPFKEWQKEHEIIKLSSKEAILLLGRSGTGKTTCCLYRLWNEFKNYWNPDSKVFGLKIPRRTLISSSSLGCSDEDEEDSLKSPVISDDSGSEDDDIFVDCVDTLPSRARARSSNSGPGVFVAGDRAVVEEDLHQVFVTKNYVLCDQMKKRFYCMAAAHDFLEPHLLYEEEPLPNSFAKFENLSFPAFLTARQFYILLDNSLGGADTFFTRDTEGNLQVKISSLDYDHEDADILLDLEHSDSEGEDVETIYASAATQSSGAPKQHSASRWTEVTALYFKEIVWPKIAQQYAKEFDPMLVWLEIQSFIKGSELAIRKGAPLSFAEYKDIGNRMAPNFSNHRDAIYKLFKKYQRFVQNCRHSDYLFDECDLVMNLHQRLKNTTDVPWSIHSVYIDEVQDFTQAELAIFIHCCRDPNSMFFTGDTAQSIMRGIAFRFQDLRSCFHRINQKVPYINVPQDPLKLTINYRSHSGILKLAGSVIDLISEFFKDSIDHLPDDEGMFPGPVPIFLDSCEVKDLSLLLSTNKRECSAIEFGAHQVILVQSKEAKDKLPDILKGAIVLTIFEAKGLEFDDVLLYNFFTDSLVSEKGWRVITSYLEMSHHRPKITNKNRLPGSSAEPRSKPFDPTHHKSLNAELKYLYTAVTRAKCNLWIYDSNKKNRLPMLDYWHKRDAVKVVMANGSASGQDYNLVFASNSTPEQWSSQGDNFRKKHLWEQAILCYEKAGPDYAYLAKEAYAYHFIQEARQQKPQLFINAALSFFERDELTHSVHCLNGAALCLKNSRPPRHKQAANLFERLGDPAKAAQCFLKDRDFDNFARIKESQGEYDSVIKSLQGKPFMRKREALAKADEYEKKGYKLDPKYTPSELSFSCAMFYSRHKDNKILLEVLQYMPEQEKRIKFMKEAGLFNEAFNAYVEDKQSGDAYRLALAQGWFDRGIELARKEGDEVTESKFVVELAKDLHLREVEDVVSKNKELVDQLKKVSCSAKDELLKAEANLVMGMLLKSSGPCITALLKFKMLKHKAGIIESFNQVTQLGKYSDQDILDYSHVAKNVSSTLSKNISDIHIDVKQAVKLCGLQLVGRVYVTSKFSNVFISQETLSRYLCDSAGFDIDGMMRLKYEIREDLIAKRYKGFIDGWLKQSKIESKLMSKLQRFPLHSQLHKNRRLHRVYTPQEVSSVAMRDYLQVCVHLLELFVLMESSSVDGVVAHVLAIFSPQVSIYLPQRLEKDHLQVMRRSDNSRKGFITYIEEEVAKKSLEGAPEHVKIDKWLSVWRASCVAQPNMKCLLEAMKNMESEVNKEAEKSKEAKKEASEKFEVPPAYIYWRNDKQYCHIFSFWLSSCSDLREKGRALWAAKLAINHFMGNIAENKQVSISVMNCVYILTVHCTALLAMITHANTLQGYTATFTVPLMYKHMVQLFSHMNCRQETSDKSLLAACVEEVSSHRNLHELFRECKQLLIRAMGYLLGTHSRAPGYSMLKYGLQGSFSSNDSTRLCLIFTLTLFGNLTMLKVYELRQFADKILYILKKTISKGDRVPLYVKKVYEDASKSHDFTRPAFVFNLVAELLNNSKIDNSMSKLALKRGRIEFLRYEPQSSSSTQPKPPVTSPSRVAEKLPPASKSVQSTEPSHSELGVASPITAPIGIERRQAASLSATGSSYIPTAKQPEESVVPSVVPYVPASITPDSQPVTPIPSHHSSDAPLTATIVAQYKMGESLPWAPVQQTASVESLSSSVDPIQPNLTPGSVLTPFAPEFVPGVAMSSSSTDLQPQAVDPMMYYPPEMYQFQDEAFAYYAGPQEDMGVAYNYEGDYGGVSYGLTQQPALVIPAVPVDPNMVGEEIIDDANSLCNVCGVHYRLMDEVEDDIPMEDYYTHVTGVTHHSNTVAFKRFKLILGELTEVGSENFRLIEFAETKLAECKEMKTRVDSEPLEQLIDSLQDQINKYHLKVSQFEDRRQWEEGVKVITGMNEQLNCSLKSAHDQLRKFAEVSRQREVAKNLEDEEELDEIEQFSEKTLEAEVKSGRGKNGGGKQGDMKMRTAQEKEQSRSRKRSKKTKH